MVRTGSIIVVLMGAAAVFFSCAGNEGTDPYAMWSTYEHPAGLFHFHYLSPPWQKVHDQSTQDRPVFVIVSDSTFQDAGAVYDLRLEAFAVEEGDMESVREATEARWEQSGFEFARNAKLTSASGDTGLRSNGRGAELWVAIGYQESDRGVAVMEVSGEADVNTADVALLLKSLEPRPSEDE